MASDAADHIVQGNLLVGQGQFDRAVAEYTEAIRIEPRSALAYMGRGVARAKAGQVKQAIADQTEAIRIDPGLAAAFRNRGRDHWTRGAVKPALADFTEAIRLLPASWDCYHGRAAAYRLLGGESATSACATPAAWAVHWAAHRCASLARPTGGTSDPVQTSEPSADCPLAEASS